MATLNEELTAKPTRDSAGQDARMRLAHCGHDTWGVKVRVWQSQQRLECANFVGAFARGTGASAASWLALAKNSGDKSPHSKRWRDCKTAASVPTPGLCDALNRYGCPALRQAGRPPLR